MALGAAIPGPVRAPFRPLPEVSPRQPRGSRKPPEAAPGSRKPSQANRCSAAALCKPRAVRAELYTNVGYGHAVWHAPILFNPGSLPRQPGCSEAAVVLPAAFLAELSTNEGYGHAGWHAPVVLGADSAYGAAALHARILVPLALSCASGVALHAGPREQCSPTTAGVHQGPCKPRLCSSRPNLVRTASPDALVGADASAMRRYAYG